ncbi:MAG: hypothetical protein RLZZ528_1684 [Pseudomonadota bacterium]|jgi:HlyD family secretion protein
MPALAQEQTPLVRDDLFAPVLAGGLGLGVLLAACIGWAQFTTISGAVIAHGQTVVEGKPKVVQTLDGGEIDAINVHDGDAVRAGDVLVRLDPTLPQVNLDIARTKLADALARRARLTAEQLGMDVPAFAYGKLPFDLPDTSREEEGQRQIFLARVEVLRGLRDRLAEAREQFTAQIAGTEGQIASVREQIDLLAEDIRNVEALVEQGLARQSQLTDLKRSEADLTGRLAGLESELARTRTAIRDAEIETLQSERSFREEVVTELREVTAIVDELTLEIINRSAQLERIDIRAPVDGIVHQSQVTTVGGVLAAGATILEVVPVADGVDFSARIDPRAVDQVHPGQAARIVLSAFPSRTTPDLHGKLLSVSPGAITDPITGQHYFEAAIDVPADELAKVTGAEIVPGMPVEVYLATADRSVMSYLLGPLVSQFRMAFREE